MSQEIQWKLLEKLLWTNGKKILEIFGKNSLTKNSEANSQYLTSIKRKGIPEHPKIYSKKKYMGTFAGTLQVTPRKKIPLGIPKGISEEICEPVS